MYSVCYGKVIPAKYLVSESRIEAPASVLCNASAMVATQTATLHGKQQQTARDNPEAGVLPEICLNIIV